MQKVNWKPHPGPQTESLRRPEFEVLYGGARGGGKAQDYNSLVLTPKGYKKLFDIKIGDQIISSKGTYQRVTGIFPQGERQLYLVEFNDGCEVSCTLDHLWLVHFSNTKRKDGVYSLGEIKEILGKTKNVNVSVDLVMPVKFEERGTSLDPYLLGLILGDGYIGARSIKFSTADEQLLGEFEEKGFLVNYLGQYDYRVGLGHSGKRNSLGQFVSKRGSLFKEIEKLGLAGRKSYDKFIPENYLKNSPEKMLALLQGLMDTDGYADERGHLEFASASVKLAEGALFLIRHLGGYASLKRAFGKNRVYGRFNNGIKPFRLERKNVRLKPYNGGQSKLRKRIVAIRRDKRAEAVCISVSSPDGLYITDGATVTHNTDAGMAWLLEPQYLKNPRYRALIIRRNADDLSDWVDRAREMYRDTGATFAYRPVIITFPTGAVFRTGHLKDENAYGKYIGHEYHKMLIEELTQIPTEKRYLQLISSCRSTVPELRPQIFGTTNPGDIGHAWVKARFVDIASPGTRCIDPNTGRSRIFIPAKVTDNPTLMETNPEYLDFLNGLPDQLRRAWRDGDWDIVAGQVFTEWLRQTHVVKPFLIPKEWPRWISIDWGVNNPCAVGWYSQGYDGRTYLYRELYMDGTAFLKTFGRPMTAQRMARVILKITKKAEEDYLYCVADPSMWNKPEGGPSIAELMITCHHEDKDMSEGLKMVKGDNDRYNGLARYREALSIAPDGKPWYQVFESCVDTIRTIPALPYDLRKVEDVNTDAEDHCFDRDRYFFMSRPVKPTKPMVEKRSPLARMYAKETGKWEGDSQYDEYEQEWLQS